MADPVVVKIGGSLVEYIDPLIEILRHSGRPALIVPGGGICARMIRELGMGGDAAHWMAVCAMEQFGWHISTRGITPVSELHVPHGLAVLLPYLPLLKADPVPHSWEVTSDTIAAWVASSLGLDLIILKSVDGIKKDGMLQERICEDIITDVVDSGFISYILAHRVNTVIMNGRRPKRLGIYLQGNPVSCTTIGF
ncbi:MAG: uridylate kinase [Methanoregulaceae archaeon]|nr:uridylate kinase [Methanoregulaceae archaeon]